MELLSSFIAFYENTNSECNTKEKYVDAFKLPIEYLDTSSVFMLNNNIINDLELVKTNSNDFLFSNKVSNKEKEEEEEEDSSKTSHIISDNTNRYNLYYHVFNPTNIFEQNTINKWSKYYTNNKEFLLETQDLIKNYKPLKKVEFAELNNVSKDETIYNTCESIIYDDGFINKYQFIDIPLLNKFNNNSMVLEMLSIYNLSTPLISLVIPILFLLLPFFIIKLQGHNVTFELYFNHLKTVFSNHIIGQFFTSLSETNITNKMYIFFSFGFYIFQMYLNINGCIRFFHNIKFIHNTLRDLKVYILDTLKKYDHYLSFSKNLAHYKQFNNIITNNISIFTSFLDNVNKISPYSLSINALIELGQLMKCFFNLNKNDEFISSLYFSFGFNGYLKNIESLQNFINNKVMNYCNYNNNKPTSFDESYFANLNNINSIEKCKTKIIKNSYKLDKNIIITGPNASGKTTLLKSTLFNIILCQQIGCGFFTNASVKIYDYIHCYINIPDTGGRDSLYQAEARQCKNILQLIEENKNKSHFCVFDELYSGTNPDEAITSAYGYLDYLNKLKNIDYMLTTHYTKLCKKLDKQNTNLCMKVNKNANDFEYTYKIKKGISKVKGALKVLKDLEYPENIIINMK
jgi:hypothetical protein